jgi:hypothetical protein
VHRFVAELRKEPSGELVCGRVAVGRAVLFSVQDSSDVSGKVLDRVSSEVRCGVCLDGSFFRLARRFAVVVLRGGDWEADGRSTETPKRGQRADFGLLGAHGRRSPLLRGLKDGTGCRVVRLWGASLVVNIHFEIWRFPFHEDDSSGADR